MAREIVDSGAPVPADPEDGRGAAAVTAEDSAVPVLDLGELDDGRGARAPEDGPAGLASQVRSVFGRLRNDAGYRGLAVRLVLAGLAFAALGALVTETHHRHAVARAAASRLAVDIRVDAAPLVEEPRPGVQYIRGDSSIDVKLHNLGPTPVHLTALRYELGDANPRTCYLVNTDVTVRSDEQMDRAFHVVLPCGPTRETAVPRRPVLLTARIRTNDGRTHSVPVDLTALDQQGGLFDSCAAYRRGFDLNVDSRLVHGGVQMSLDLPPLDVSGADTVAVSIARAGVPPQVGFITSPHLPVTVRSGTRFTVTIRPVVHGCPRATDLAALSALGVAYGPGDDDTYPDPYLPLLVAQAVGRACASPGK